MNYFLIDVNNSKNYLQKKNILKKLKYFFIYEEVLKILDKCNVISININEKKLEKIFALLSSNKFYIKKLGSIYSYIFKKHLLKILNCKKYLNTNINPNNNCILSKSIKKNIRVYNYIYDILSSININYIDVSNSNFENDILNIQKYIEKNNISCKEVKLLVLVNYIKNFDSSILLKYIEKYKYIDVLKVGEKSKLLLSMVNNINKEYGTSIQVISSRNISKYNIYVNIDVKSDDIEKYILSRKRYILNMQNVEEDEFNKYNIFYEKNNYIIYNIQNISKYSKTELGYMLNNIAYK